MSNTIDPRGWVKNFGIVAPIENNGVAVPTRGSVTFDGGFAVTDDPTNDTTHITIPSVGNAFVHAQSATYAVLETSGETTVVLSALGADATISLSNPPSKGQKLCIVVKDGSLAAHNVIFTPGHAANVYVQGVNQGASYEITLGQSQNGAVFWFLYDGTDWVNV